MATEDSATRRGFGFVQMEDAEDAKRAIAKRHGALFRNKVLFVRELGMPGKPLQHARWRGSHKNPERIRMR